MKRVLRCVLSLILVSVLVVGLVPGVAASQANIPFSVSTKTMIKDMSKYSITVKVKSLDQRFGFRQSDVTTFKIKSKTQKGDEEVVKAVANIDRKVASVKTTVTLKYRFVVNKWKLTSVKFSGTSIAKINLKGVWTGTFVASQGKTRADVVIKRVTADGYITNGVFSFSATPTNPSVPSGSYTLKGGYDKKTGEVAFSGGEWIVQPEGYSMIEIHAWVDFAKKRIVSGSYNWSLDLRKVS